MKIEIDLDALKKDIVQDVIAGLRPLLSNNESMGEILTAEKLCEYIHVPKSKIYHLVHLDQIPFFRIGRVLRFKRKEIDAWMAGDYTSNRTRNHKKGRDKVCQNQK